MIDALVAGALDALPPPRMVGIESSVGAAEKEKQHRRFDTVLQQSRICADG
jgi:hypothetical protein